VLSDPIGQLDASLGAAATLTQSLAKINDRASGERIKRRRC
jgi:hypothetical protein